MTANPDVITIINDDPLQACTLSLILAAYGASPAVRRAVTRLLESRGDAFEELRTLVILLAEFVVVGDAAVSA